MAGLRWLAIAGLAGGLSVVLGGTFAFTIARSRIDSMPKPAPDPHALPLDYADPELRRALDAHAEFNLRGGLDDIADGCDDGERYQVVVTPGVLGSDFVAVEVDVAGAAAVATIRRFRTDPNGGGGRWRISSQQTFGEREIETIRAAVARLLLSQMPPAIEDGYGDAAEWIAETCRKGRYHFWRRRNADDSRPEQAPFVAFARILLAFAGPANRRARPAGQLQ